MDFNIIEFLSEKYKENVKFISLKEGDALYVDNDEEGAIKRGARVKKHGFLPGDMHEPGMLGTVMGSVGDGNRIGYFVSWDDKPDYPLFIADVRIREVKGE